MSELCRQELRESSAVCFSNLGILGVVGSWAFSGICGVLRDLGSCKDSSEECLLESQSRCLDVMCRR